MRSHIPPRNAFSPTYVPVLNIPASDIAIRPEFDVLFSHANISAEDLITLDDLPTSSDALPPKSTQWILVDHNKLQGALGQLYSTRVHGVIDHHEEENTVPRDTDPEPRIVEKSASCTSLVVRYFKDDWNILANSPSFSRANNAQEDSLNDDNDDSDDNNDADSEGWDAEIAKMAIASVLIDTSNMTSETKVERVDRAAASYLEVKILRSSNNPEAWDRTEYYEELDKAKKDISNLPLADILRKDYKEWTEGNRKLGISSVVKPLDFLKDKAWNESSVQEEKSVFGKAMEDFAHARDLDIFAITTHSTLSEGNYKRELFLQSRENTVDAVSSFEKDATDELGLELLRSISSGDPHVEGEEYVWQRAWLQKDVSKSRKQIAPLLRGSMQTHSGTL